MRKIITLFAFFALCLHAPAVVSDDVELKKYPDPENGVLRIITANDLGEKSELKIFNSTGYVVIHQTLSREILEIPVETLQKGVYYGIIKNQSFTERFRFYKK